MRGNRSRWHRRAAKHELEAIRGELSRLVEENARLRLDDQRTMSLLVVGAKAQAMPEAVAAGTAQLSRSVESSSKLLMPLVPVTGSIGLGDSDGEHALDEAWRVLAEAKVLQTTVLAVLQDLQVACAQMERHLTTGSPSSEIDRRVVARRGDLGRQRTAAEYDFEETNETIILPSDEDSLDRGSHARVAEDSVEQH